MKVIDLPAEEQKSYFACLEEWSPEMKDAGDAKERWYRRHAPGTVRVKVAVDDSGTIGGMIQYVPIETVPVIGKDLWYMYCIWVHGHRQGRGNFQGKGMGRALLAAAEEDARQRGAKGFVVWGMSIPVFMRASWFRRQGYRRVDRDGLIELLWKPFSADATAPAMPKLKKKPPVTPGKVTVTALRSGWCPAQNAAFERARRAAEEFSGAVEFTAIDTFDPAVGLEWGESDALFIDGRQVRTGPPPSFEKLRRLIAARLRRLGSHSLERGT